MRHVRAVLVVITLLGCGSGGSSGRSAATSAQAADVARATPSLCERDAAACALSGFADRSQFFEDVADERARLAQACREDDVACQTLAQSYGYHPLRVPPDSLRSAEINETLCTAGDAGACWNGAESLLMRHDAPGATARAAALLDRACALGIPEYCFLAGVERLPNGTLPSDPSLAFTQLRAACEREYFAACVSLLQAGAGGLFEALPPTSMDARFLAHPESRTPSTHVAAARARCGHRSGAAFYAPLVNSLATLAPPASLTAPGALAPGRLTVALQRQVTCTLEGAYGDQARGELAALRYVRVLAAIPGGLDVFIEWSDTVDGDVLTLHATRAHVTPEHLRVVADLPFEIHDGDPESFHDTRLDVDGDGLRDVLMTLGTLSPGAHDEAFIFAASRAGGLSRVIIPNDTQGMVDGCFVPGQTTPTLLLMHSERDDELGWSESCVALHVFPAFEYPSVAPITYTLGPRLAADEAIPVLPPGGVPVLRERERPYDPNAAFLHGTQRELADSDWLPFGMCPEHPVFLLRGFDGEQSVVQTVADIARSERGDVGPGISTSTGVLPCELFE